MVKDEFRLVQRVRIQLGQPFRTLGIERRHVGFVGFNPIAARKHLRHVVDWSSCLKMMDGCRMAIWYVRVLVTDLGVGRCHQIHGKKLTIVYPGDVTLGFFFLFNHTRIQPIWTMAAYILTVFPRDSWCYCLYLCRPVLFSDLRSSKA